MKNFIDTLEVYNSLHDKNTVIVDCRGDLKDIEYGEIEYASAHIEGAVFMDIKKELSSEQTLHGGRNPLPDLEKFKEKLESIGIGNETRVIAYDEQRIACAARFCWMLRHIGHKNNFILNGGIGKWIRDGYALTREIPKYEKNKLNIKINDDIYADVKYVKDNINSEFIIDSRTDVRYRGEMEIIDPKAGHIPNAVNYYWKNFLNKDGTIIDIEELKKVFQAVKGLKGVTVYCGSGIDAAFNYMLLDEIGVMSRLYVGSWSDWITYSENIIIGGK